MNLLFATCRISVLSLLAMIAMVQLSSSGSVDQTCSCTAADGSCAVTITCTGGCVRFCGVQDNCWAECSSSNSDRLKIANIEVKNGTYSQLVRALRSVSDKNLEFSPAEPESRVDVAFRNAPLWDALEFLAARGTLRVDANDFDSLRKQRKLLLSGGKTSFIFKNKPLKTFIEDMTFLTGLHLRVASGNNDAVVSIDLRNVTLRQILNAVSRQTGARIKEG